VKARIADGRKLFYVHGKTEVEDRDAVMYITEMQISNVGRVVLQLSLNFSKSGSHGIKPPLQAHHALDDSGTGERQWSRGRLKPALFGLPVAVFAAVQFPKAVVMEIFCAPVKFRSPPRVLEQYLEAGLDRSMCIELHWSALLSTIPQSKPVLHTSERRSTLQILDTEEADLIPPRKFEQS
jgi:hypothetical protein